MAFALLRTCGARQTLPLFERQLKVLSSTLAFSAESTAAVEKTPYQKDTTLKTSPVCKTFVSTSVRKYSKKTAAPERAYDSDDDSDSDDERDRTPRRQRKERGNSEFWRRKMRTLHGVMDVNKDGVISYDDFMLLTEKFASLGHLDAKAKNEFRDIMRTTWEQQWGEITPYNLVTVEQYLTEMHHVVNDKDLKKKVHRFLPYLYKAVDKDRSGSISLNEFKLFFRCLGLTEENAAVSFAVIDKNGDGQITLDEFVKLGKDFFVSEKETHVSRMFWGPLVDH